MQITKAKVTPFKLDLRKPVRMANTPEISQVTAIFVRLETRQGQVAWGCTIAHPALNREKPADVIRICKNMADRARELHPTNLEYSLGELATLAEGSNAALGAFDLAFYDLLGLATGLPLYKLLGGYRNQIQTSATIPIADVPDSVEMAQERALKGFRMLKLKGGVHPEEDVERIKTIHRKYPDMILRLDADGGYSIQAALEVAKALEGKLEMLEQPTAPDDLDGLREVTRNSPVPIMADQSVGGPPSALELTSKKVVAGLSIKVATCGGLRCARQIETIARAGHLATMVSCMIEPALLIAAGLSLALSSPNVQYSDLDGHMDVQNDPSIPGFDFQEGWLIARDVPGLGCSVNLN